MLEEGNEVHGIKRREALFNTQRIGHSDCNRYPHRNNQRLKLHHDDLTDSSNLMRSTMGLPPETYG